MPLSRFENTQENYILLSHAETCRPLTARTHAVSNMLQTGYAATLRYAFARAGAARFAR